MALLANEEIVTMYDELGLSVEEICDDTGYEAAAVKVVLSDRSTKYNIATSKKNPKPGELSDGDLEEMTDVIRSIARNGENDGIRLKAACYLRDDRLGRLDIAKSTENKNSLNINVLMLNQGLKKLRALKESFKSQGELIEA